MAGHTALLVVHGIGAQRPGENVDKLARGLRLVDRDFAPQKGRDGVTATFGGQPVRLYEVYWADLLKGDVTRGAFQMNELQSLSWFPWFNLRRGNYRTARYSFLKLAWWCGILPIVNFFVLFAYYGAGLFAEIFSGAAAKRERKEHRATLNVVDGVLDEYAGDVFSYVNSAGKAFYREKGEPTVPEEVQHVFPRIVQRFYDQLLKADADGCDAIQIVAHSLGTVVTYHALSGFGFDSWRVDAKAIEGAKGKIRRVYTIGSPLEKIRFFWPRIAPVRTPPGDTNFRWDNFVSFFDPVSGIISSFDDWGTVSNHRLLGGGFILGHVVYEHSPVFLSALAEGLCGRAIPFRRRLTQRLRDVLLLAGETLFAPAALAVILAIGAALFTLVAMLIPYLVSWTVRWFVPPETWAPVVDAASLVILGLMILTFLVAPAIRASKVHALHWIGNRTEATSRQAV